jgi:hypothetical protein
MVPGLYIVRKGIRVILIRANREEIGIVIEF